MSTLSCGWLVAGVRQAEAAGFTAARSPEPPHLARGETEGGGVVLEEALWMFPANKEGAREIN